MDLARHVAGGDRWAGCRVRDGAALYIAAEGGFGIGNRVAAIEGREGLKLWILPTTVDLCKSNTDTKALIEMIKRLAETHGGYTLIVVDTLARSMGQGDENASPDMGSFVRNIDLLRTETGAHVMCIHHTGKDASKGARGHSSLRAATDTEIELVRDDDVIVAETRKQRDLPGGSRFAYRLAQVVLGEDQDVDPVTTCRVEPCDAPDRGPAMSPQTERALRALDDELVEHGEVKRETGLPECRVVTRKKWRDRVYQLGISDSDKRDSQKTAFNRAARKLKQGEYIGENNGFVWKCLE